MTPLEALSRLSGAQAQDPHLTHPELALCAACREALLGDLEALFVPIAGRHTRLLEHSTVMGFTFSDGPQEACALHPLLHEGTDVCP
jgi:hypothetical protein